MTDLDYEPVVDRTPASQNVAGFLASLAIFTSLIGVAWHPLRLIPVAIIVSLIAAGMGGRQNRLAYASALICAACFFFGMTIAVVLSKPLF